MTFFKKVDGSLSISSYYGEKFENTLLNPATQSYNLQITGDENRCGYISYGSALLSQVIIPSMKDNNEFKPENNFMESFFKHLGIKTVDEAHELLEKILVLDEKAQNQTGLALLKSYIDIEENNLLDDYNWKLKSLIINIIQRIEKKECVTLEDADMFHCYNIVGISDINYELHDLLLEIAEKIVKHRKDTASSDNELESVNSFLNLKNNNEYKEKLNLLAKSHVESLKTEKTEIGWTQKIEDDIVKNTGHKVETLSTKNYEFHQKTPNKITFLEIKGHVSRLLLPSEIDLINEKLSLANKNKPGVGHKNA